MTDPSDLENFTSVEDKRVEEAFGWALLLSGGVMSGVGIGLDMLAVGSMSILVLASQQVLLIGGLILSRTVDRRARRRAIAAGLPSRPLSPQPRGERAAVPG
jgi:hypothetical protein